MTEILWTPDALTKRRFLIGAGSTAIGLAAARFAQAADDKNSWDLIVVGAGTAGIPAAVFAAHRGVRVLLIEASAQLGGTLHLSTGQMSAAGTKVQKSKGIVDTPAEHLEDVWRISKGTVNRDLVKLAVDNAAEAYDWLMDSGFDMIASHPVKGRAHEPYSKDRYYWGTENGVSIVKVLEQQLKPEIAAGRVTWLARHQAKQLVSGVGGAITGVITEGEDGKSAAHRGKFVLLATGGFNSNVKMYEDLQGVKHYARMSYPYAQGQGHDMAMAVGAYVRGKENYLSNFGGIMETDEPQSHSFARFNTYPERRQPWEIYVNVRGERFVREDVPSVDHREHALLKQPDLRYWVVFDHDIFKQSPVPIEGWDREQFEAAFKDKAMFFMADSLEELAKKTGVNAAGLAASVAAYNKGREAKKDAFGRKHMPLAIAKAPFYAIRQQGYSITSTVGIAVNNDLQVIRKDGSAIKGLYAAGEIIGTSQLMGSAFCGGMNVMPAIAFGKMLGQRMIPLTSA
ncbi:MAG: FAD-binding protein [Alphaproteobacteria bacterium]|nr:FAD-binding protein [Alphaproteobacteria bacterium]